MGTGWSGVVSLREVTFELSLKDENRQLYKTRVQEHSGQRGEWE